MTELMYQTDSYMREFTAQITAVDPERRAVVLDRTAFYPGGGGQPHDTGTLEVDGVPHGTWRLPARRGDALHMTDCRAIVVAAGRPKRAGCDNLARSYPPAYPFGRGRGGGGGLP